VKVVFHRAADDELGEAARWYGARSEGLDDDFEEEVMSALDVISEAPLAFREWPEIPGIRVFNMSRFPYLIIYTLLPTTLLPTGDGLLVLAVAHSSRAPGYWAGRS
jgi:toxin ParE1/3/4